MSSNWFQKLGPGLLYAGAAVGVSHLVQSTRAGAEYGLLLIPVVVLANVLKWPFFVAGPIYAAHTGQSLVQGYYQLGKTPFYINLLICIGTVPGILGAVTLVTAGIFNVLMMPTLSVKVSSAAILALCLALLLRGRYAWLDRIVKWIVILLSASTLLALAFAWKTPSKPYWPEVNWLDGVHFTFLIALMGWMPSPIDLSIWQSLWSVEKFRIQPQAREGYMFDFNTGFWGTTLLAVVFLLLGYFSLYGRVDAMPENATAFAGMFVQMYESSLGPALAWVVKVAALACMFSTVLTVLDAYPRVIAESISTLRPQTNKSRWRTLFLWVTALGGLSVIVFFQSNMKALVTFATVVSFVTAPILAVFNATLLYRIGFFNKSIWNVRAMLTLAGLLYLIGFSALYLFSLFRG
ncbi:membrane protein [Thermaurantimonas aggregans]|uniref:Membrane protein n=1 Tax=Thermaurantimonas aggregans TaxID=2173829 RepID=A0A401XI43_9FLAO|nr:divalent metal cation transporter [Thermaurantimonas aggregans]GCD76676.1 membrane protein [Thermaurantimonas aggregans]